MGLSGDDTLNGGAGADTMYGDAGNDTYVVDNIGDRAIEGSSTGGTDTVQSSVTFSLDSADGQFIEKLILTGTSSVNGTGNGLNNTLTGNSGGNTLFGLDGDDVITGGGDGDLLTGGAGHDQFVYAALTDSGSTKPTRDQITDFVQGDDVVDLIGARRHHGRGRRRVLVHRHGRLQRGRRPVAAVHLVRQHDRLGRRGRQRCWRLPDPDQRRLHAQCDRLPPVSGPP